MSSAPRVIPRRGFHSLRSIGHALLEGLLGGRRGRRRGGSGSRLDRRRAQGAALLHRSELGSDEGLLASDLLAGRARHGASGRGLGCGCERSGLGDERWSARARLLGAAGGRRAVEIERTLGWRRHRGRLDLGLRSGAVRPPMLGAKGQKARGSCTQYRERGREREPAQSRRHRMLWLEGGSCGRLQIRASPNRSPSIRCFARPTHPFARVSLQSWSRPGSS